MNSLVLSTNLQVNELNYKDLQNTDGGALIVLAAAALVTLGGCTINVNTGDGNINNSSEASADSTNVNVGHGSGNNM